MNRKEFLEELENALAGRIPDGDVKEILSDYHDIFTQGEADGKTDSEVSAQIGSPAKIARRILEDGETPRYEKTSRIFDRIVEPDCSIDTTKLASMGQRLGAYVLDWLFLGVVSLLLMFVLFAPVFFARYFSVDMIPTLIRHKVGFAEIMSIVGSSPRFFSLNIVFTVILFGVSNLFTTVILWATNGYSPGKWILRIRVVKLDGNKITFLDALLRELVLKGIANSIVSGILNVVSFIWGCVSEDRKTVHDLAAQTRVMKINRSSERNQRNSR